MKRLCKPFKANKDTLLSGTVNISLHFVTSALLVQVNFITSSDVPRNALILKEQQDAHRGSQVTFNLQKKTLFAFEAFFVTPNFVGFPPTCHVAILSCCLLTTDNFMFHRNSGLLYM